MSRIEKLEQRLESVNDLANSVAVEANKELSIAKHRITCLTVLVALFAVIGASIAFYSIHTMKELFYSMEIEEEIVYEQDVDQETNGEGNNYFINNSDNNMVGE